MTRVGCRSWLVLATMLFLLTASLPAVGASPKYLTTGITSSGLKETTLEGYQGVLVNYTSTYSSPFAAFVYMDVVNSAGQTVYWNLGYCSFQPIQKVGCFVAIGTTLLKGIYNVRIFATTNSSVPVSVTSSLQMTV
jgi:hypothetical protein